MIYLYSGFYSEDLLRGHPDKLFVFGDNAQRFGKGGQAAIRDEPNAVGVATKMAPGNSGQDFFAEGNAEHMGIVAHDLRNLQGIASTGKTIILPVLKYGGSSLGCGLAELPTRAPTIYGMINSWQRAAVSQHGELK